MDQLPGLGKRELICLLLFTCNYVVSVWRGFLFLWVLGNGYVILLWHSLSLPYNYFVRLRVNMEKMYCNWYSLGHMTQMAATPYIVKTLHQISLVTLHRNLQPIVHVVKSIVEPLLADLDILLHIQICLLCLHQDQISGERLHYQYSSGLWLLFGK